MGEAERKKGGGGEEEERRKAAAPPTSLWNNGVGWEERNHSLMAEAALRASLPTLTVQGQVGAAGRLQVTLRGLGEGSRVESSVNLRKGKAICVFDFSLSVPWDALWIPTAPAAAAAASGGGGGGGGGAAPPEGTLFASGLLTTHSVGPDDVAEDFPVTLRITHAPAAATPAMTTLLRAVRELASGPLTALLRQTLRAMAAWLPTLDSGEAAQSAAAERRQGEAAMASWAPPAAGGVAGSGAAGGSAAAAAATSSSSAASILSTTPQLVAAGAPGAAKAPQSAGEREAAEAALAAAAAAAAAATAAARGVRAVPLVAAAAKMAASAAASAVSLPVAPHRVVDAGEAPELTASKWNRGGWGYEDKDISPWAHKHLLAKLGGFDIAMPGGHVKVVDVEDLRGEAAIILKRGARAIIFDLSFVLKWEGTLVDGAGERIGVGDGEVVVTDLDQDSFSIVSGGSSGSSGSSSSGKRCKLEVPVKIRAAEDGGAKDDALARIFTQHGLTLLQARLAEYCAELLSYEG